MVKHFLPYVVLAYLLAGPCMAVESANSGQASSVFDYEQHVRKVAEQTALEAKAKKEQERLERSKAIANKNPEPFRIYKYKKDGAMVFSDVCPTRPNTRS